MTGTVKHQTSDQAPSLPGRELHWGLGVGSPLPHGAGGPRAAGPAQLGRGPPSPHRPGRGRGGLALTRVLEHPSGVLSQQLHHAQVTPLQPARGKRPPSARRPDGGPGRLAPHSRPAGAELAPKPCAEHPASRTHSRGHPRRNRKQKRGALRVMGGSDTRGVACESGRGDPTAKGPAFPGAAVQEPGRRAWSPCSEVSRCPRAARGRKTNQEEPDREGDRRERPRREIPTGEAGWEVGRGVGARGVSCGPGGISGRAAKRTPG